MVVLTDKFLQQKDAVDRVCVFKNELYSRCTTPDAVLSVMQGRHQFHCAVDRGADEAE
jgi:hypothetical protein